MIIHACGKKGEVLVYTCEYISETPQNSFHIPFQFQLPKFIIQSYITLSVIESIFILQCVLNNQCVCCHY